MVKFEKKKSKVVVPGTVEAKKEKLNNSKAAWGLLASISREKNGIRISSKLKPKRKPKTKS